MIKIKRNAFGEGINLTPSPEEEILKAMKECSRIAAKNGISDMMLEEINEEIGKARAYICISANKA